jgi:hypothetical protein
MGCSQLSWGEELPMELLSTPGLTLSPFPTSVQYGGVRKGAKISQPGQPPQLHQPLFTLPLLPPPPARQRRVKGSRKEAATAAAVLPVWGLPPPLPSHLHHQHFSVARPSGASWCIVRSA